MSLWFNSAMASKAPEPKVSLPESVSEPAGLQRSAEQISSPSEEKSTPRIASRIVAKLDEIVRNQGQLLTESRDTEARLNRRIADLSRQVEELTKAVSSLLPSSPAIPPSGVEEIIADHTTMSRGENVSRKTRRRRAEKPRPMGQHEQDAETEVGLDQDPHHDNSLKGSISESKAENIEYSQDMDSDDESWQMVSAVHPRTAVRKRVIWVGNLRPGTTRHQ